LHCLLSVMTTVILYWHMRCCFAIWHYSVSSLIFWKLEVEICVSSLCHGCKNSCSCYTTCHDGLIFCSSVKVCRPIPGSVELETTNTSHERCAYVYVYVYARISNASSEVLIGDKSVSNRHCGAKQNVCLIHPYLLVLRLWELITARLIQ
jgi:hypothetical protein